MRKLTASTRGAALTLLSLAAIYGGTALVSFGSETRTWEQSDLSDFAQGTLKGLSIRSDGRITLAPRFKELDSTGTPYLWAIAQDSKGTLYYAGGAPTGASTKIFALTPGGKPRVFAEVPGLEIHSLAVDREDRVYAAVLPDAKVYRIEGGKPQVFFDPKCKYIWTIAFDASGNLFVATGDNGLIYKVAPDGKGAKFFDTQEAHARSLAIDSAGNLLVGTDPGGLIIRVTPSGQGFVLYQAAKREVTAVAEHAGVVYAAAVGGKPAIISGQPPVLPSTPPAITATGAMRPGTQPPSAAPAIGSLGASVTGGSNLYRIQKDGFAEEIWNSSSDLVYAISFDPAGKPLIGTGNKGIVYRIDSDHLSTELLNTPPTQVTAFLHGADGLVYAVTGNVGNLYAIGPGAEKTGTLESSVLDATEFAYWGKVHLTATPHGGEIAVATRSGNVNNPRNSWSAWAPVELSEQGGPVRSPAARFLQYRLTLNASASGNSPELSAIDIPFLSKNVAPKITQLEIAPFNYRQPPGTSVLERTVTASGSPLTLSLPAVGQRKGGNALSLESNAGATLQYSKGFVTVRWNAGDVNGDTLLYKVELRAKNSDRWQVLKDKLQDRFYSFDSAAFPDGQYLVRVTASDAPSNPPANALTSSLESDAFTIDNTPPEITDVAMSKEGGECKLRFAARDALSWIDKAEYSLDGGEWIQLRPDNFVTDSQVLHFTVVGKPGQMVSVRVFDEDDNGTVKQIELR